MSGNLGSYTTASSFLRNENEQRRQILSGEKSAEDYSIWDSMLPAVKEGAELKRPMASALPSINNA